MINKLGLLASLLLTFLYQKIFHQSYLDTLYSDTVLKNQKKFYLAKGYKHILIIC